MRLHNLDNLAAATENLLPPCSRVRNKVVSGSYQLCSDLWKHEPSFWNKEATATQLTRKATVTQSGITTAGFISSRRKPTFSVWCPESQWKGYIFIKTCVGRACRASCRRRDRTWVWKYFQVQARRPVISCPKLPASVPPSLSLHEGHSHQPSGRAICCPSPLPHSPSSLLT